MLVKKFQVGQAGRSAGRRKAAKKHGNQSTPVYRKEGKVVVETNSKIDPRGGRRARLYLEREAKTCSFVNAVRVKREGGGGEE